MDERGRKGWARCIHSVEHTVCPDLQSNHGFIRAELSNSGLVVFESGVPEQLEVFVIMDIKMRGKSPNWVAKLYMNKKLRAVREMTTCLQKQRRNRLLKSMRSISTKTKQSSANGTPPSSFIANIVIEEECSSCGEAFRKVTDGFTCRTCFSVRCIGML